MSFVFLYLPFMHTDQVSLVRIMLKIIEKNMHLSWKKLLCVLSSWFALWCAFIQSHSRWGEELFKFVCAFLQCCLTIQVRLLYNIPILHFSPHFYKVFQSQRVSYITKLQKIQVEQKWEHNEVCPLAIFLTMQVALSRLNGSAARRSRMNHPVKKLSVNVFQAIF